MEEGGVERKTGMWGTESGKPCPLFRTRAPELCRDEVGAGQEGITHDLLAPACPKTMSLWSICTGPGSEQGLKDHLGLPPAHRGTLCLNTSCTRQLTTSHPFVL